MSIGARQRLGRVVIDAYHSRTLEGNPLGDPANRDVAIYLPPSYDMDTEHRFPVVYMLMGFLGRGISMLNAQPFEPNIAERMDELIANGMDETILVLPDCFTAFGGSQYLNSSATGNYEDYLVSEIVPFVDCHYRTVPKPGARGVTGKSSGGYGAMVMGMRHSDVFGAVACHSGDMYFEMCYKPDFPKLLTAIERAGGLTQWWEQFKASPKKSRSDMEALNVLAMAAAYSPNPERPMGVELPFNLHTGELRPEIWERWLEHDPVYMASRYADALRSLRWLYLECGLRDQYNLQFGARIVSSRLKAMGIDHVYEEFDDDHLGINYRYNESLPQLVASLEKV